MPVLKTLLILICSTLSVAAAEPVNLNGLPSDLSVPEVTRGTPAPGQRVWQTNQGFEKTEIAHALYLPTDWRPGKRYPVIMEYPGNGGYRNALNDVSRGRVQDCKLGYGLSGGVWSASEERALAVARRIRTGTVNVNGGNFYGADAPFGGYNASGYGREAGLDAVLDYTSTKTTWINTSDQPMANPFVMR